MAKPKTQKQIDAELKWLLANRENVIHYSVFGDDNWKKIDAEIEVLEQDLSESDIYDRSPEGDEESDDREWNATQRDSALSVRQWMDGDDDESQPIKNWKPLIEKKTKK